MLLSCALTGWVPLASSHPRQSSSYLTSITPVECSPLPCRHLAFCLSASPTGAATPFGQFAVLILMVSPKAKSPYHLCPSTNPSSRTSLLLTLHVSHDTSSSFVPSDNPRPPVIYKRPSSAAPHSLHLLIIPHPPLISPPANTRHSGLVIPHLSRPDCSANICLLTITPVKFTSIYRIDLSDHTVASSTWPNDRPPAQSSFPKNSPTNLFSSGPWSRRLYTHPIASRNLSPRRSIMQLHAISSASRLSFSLLKSPWFLTSHRLLLIHSCRSIQFNISHIV